MDTAGFPCLHLLCSLVFVLLQASVFHVCYFAHSLRGRLPKVISKSCDLLSKEVAPFFLWLCAWTSLGSFLVCQFIVPMHPDVHLRRRPSIGVLCFLSIILSLLLMSCAARRSTLVKCVAVLTFPILTTVLCSILLALVLFPGYITVGMVLWLCFCGVLTRIPRSAALDSKTCSALTKKERRRKRKKAMRDESRSRRARGQFIRRVGPRMYVCLRCISFIMTLFRLYFALRILWVCLVLLYLCLHALHIALTFLSLLLTIAVWAMAFFWYARVGIWLHTVLQSSEVYLLLPALGTRALLFLRFRSHHFLILAYAVGDFVASVLPRDAVLCLVVANGRSLWQCGGVTILCMSGFHARSQALCRAISAVSYMLTMCTLCSPKSWICFCLLLGLLFPMFPPKADWNDKKEKVFQWIMQNKRLPNRSAQQAPEERTLGKDLNNMKTKGFWVAADDERAQSFVQQHQAPLLASTSSSSSLTGLRFRYNGTQYEVTRSCIPAEEHQHLVAALNFLRNTDLWKLKQMTGDLMQELCDAMAVSFIASRKPSDGFKTFSRTCRMGSACGKPTSVSTRAEYFFRDMLCCEDLLHRATSEGLTIEEQAQLLRSPQRSVLYEAYNRLFGVASDPEDRLSCSMSGCGLVITQAASKNFGGRCWKHYLDATELSGMLCKNFSAAFVACTNLRTAQQSHNYCEACAAKKLKVICRNACAPDIRCQSRRGNTGCKHGFCRRCTNAFAGILKGLLWGLIVT